MRRPPRVPATSLDPELEERLRKLQADLNATYNRLLGFTGAGDEHATPVADLQERAVQLETLQERAVQLESKISRLRLHAPSSDPFMEPISLAGVQEELPSDVVLLAYHVVGEEIMAFVNGDDGMRLVRNLGPVAVVAELLQRLTRGGSAFV
jgi:hypothetical protein